MIKNINILKSNITKKRGEQLKIKLNEVYSRHAFDTTSSLKQKLQESLDSELNFKCEVSNILIDNKCTVGHIHFQGTNKSTNVMHFTISYNHYDE